MDLREFREKFPQYDDMSDQVLTDRLYERHYSDMPREEFNSKIGYSPANETKVAGLGPMAEISNALTFGLGDEAAAGLAAGANKVRDLFKDGPDTPVGDAYNQYLQRIRGNVGQFREDHPAASTALGITAAAAPAVATGGASLAASGSRFAPGAAKSLSAVLGRQMAKTPGAVKALAVPAIGGAAQGFGEAEGSATERIANALQTAKTSAALGGGMSAIGKLGRSTGKLGRTLGGALYPNHKARAASILEDALADSPDTRKVLSSMVGERPGRLAAHQTAAEFTGDPRLAGLEKQLGTLGDNPGKVARAASARSGARTELLESLKPGGIGQTNEAQGSAIRDALLENYKKKSSEVGELFDSVDPTNISIIPTGRERMGSYVEALKLHESTDDIQDSGLKKLLMERMMKGDSDIPYQTLQKRRSAALEIANTAKQPRDQRLASIIAEQLDNAGQRAAKTGQGFTPEQAATWKAARKGFAENKELYEKGAVGKVLKRGNWHETKVRDDQLAKKLLNGGPEAIRQVKRATVGKPEAVNNLRAAALDELLEKGTKAGGDFSSEAGFTKHLNKHREALDTLFTKEQLEIIDEIGNDLFKEGQKGRQAFASSKGQSATSLNQTAKKALLKQITGLLPDAGLIEATIEKVGGFQRAKADEILFDALMTPEGAKGLLAIRDAPKGKASQFLEGVITAARDARNPAARVGAARLNE